MITEHEKHQLNALLAAGYNCSQSVMLHFLDSLPLSKEQVLRVAQPFEMGACVWLRTAVRYERQ